MSDPRPSNYRATLFAMIDDQALYGFTQKEVDALNWAHQATERHTHEPQPASKNKLARCRASFLRWATRHRPSIHSWADNGDALYEIWKAAWAAGRRQ